MLMVFVNFFFFLFCFFSRLVPTLCLSTITFFGNNLILFISSTPIRARWLGSMGIPKSPRLQCWYFSYPDAVYMYCAFFIDFLFGVLRYRYRDWGDVWDWLCALKWWDKLKWGKKKIFGQILVLRLYGRAKTQSDLLTPIYHLVGCFFRW